MNFIPVAKSSPCPHADDNIPTRNRNLTGSPKRSRRVESASETAE